MKFEQIYGKIQGYINCLLINIEKLFPFTKYLWRFVNIPTAFVYITKKKNSRLINKI